MAEVMKKTKHSIWKYFGAMMMEEKDGVQAVSFTRTLGVVLFVACLVAWLTKTFQGADAAIGDVPDGMLYTLWGLIGIKGFKDGMQAIRGS